ncbi:MAG: hypothetical protein HY286_19820 [Planctomycetes bacterium]|nr:hypothetical protein [Planctomycetota bacterium]
MGFAPARYLFFITAAVGIAATLYLGPRWLTAIPDPGDVVACLTGSLPGESADFARANKLADAYLAAHASEPLSKLFYYFPNVSIPNSGKLSQTWEILAPRGRIFNERLPIHYYDGRPDRDRQSYHAILEVEGRESRSYGPTAIGALRIPITPDADTIGESGAAGRLRIIDNNNRTIECAFALAPAPVRDAIRDRIYLARKLTKDHAVAFRYFCAMIFESEQCHADAFEALDVLLRVEPGNPALAAARAHCLQMLGLPEHL